MTSCYEFRDKSPELSDLIYIDLGKDIDRASKTIIIRQDEINKIKNDIEALPVRSAKVPVKNERIRVLSEDIKRLEQLKLFFEIKRKKRAVLARMEYEIALKNKKEWPDKEVFQKYMVAKKLNNSPIYTINKSDNSRSSTHKKDVQEILDSDK